MEKEFSIVTEPVALQHQVPLMNDQQRGRLGRCHKVVNVTDARIRFQQFDYTAVGLDGNRVGTVSGQDDAGRKRLEVIVIRTLVNHHPGDVRERIVDMKNADTNQ